MPGGELGMRAYILIQTEPGREADVARSAADVRGVLETAVVTGPYDVVVVAEATDVHTLGRRVLRRLQEVEGVTRTMTCPVIRR